jgi:peptide/nickel transport system permease protein
VLSVVPFIMAFPMLLMRTTMLEVREEDYITICRAKGVPGRKIFTRHAMRNSILPILTTMPIVIGAAIAGNILIETIYSWPGIGRTLVQAVLQGDFPLAQGTFLLIAVVVIVGNFVVDLLYGLLDPRITYD